MQLLKSVTVSVYAPLRRFKLVSVNIKLLQAKSYGGIPPVTVGIAFPFPELKQLSIVVAMLIANVAVPETVPLAVAVHPLESVIVTLIFPGGRLLAAGLFAEPLLQV